MGTEPTSQADPWQPGQKVEITAGPFQGMQGWIYRIDRAAGLARVKVEIFGRPTPVELPFSALKPKG